ncbi:MAG: hypothetical protein J6C64_10395 [Lachnospiraceae bacterium]|nr:hypothetical protein [Lachnospiraceae bacterium]
MTVLRFLILTEGLLIAAGIIFNARMKKLAKVNLYNYISQELSEINNQELGKKDYSFFSDLEGRYGWGYIKLLSDAQDMVIKSIIYNAIKNVAWTLDIYTLEPYLKELLTIPGYLKIAHEKIADGSAMKRASLLYLEDDDGKKVPLFMPVLQKQDYMGGKVQADKTVEEAVAELEELLMVKLSDEELLAIHKK